MVVQHITSSGILWKRLEEESLYYWDPLLNKQEDTKNELTVHLKDLDKEEQINNNTNRSQEIKSEFNSINLTL